ncbi:hypothetical protein GCM10027091_75380 [Streptomyces daliensis]
MEDPNVSVFAELAARVDALGRAVNAQLYREHPQDRPCAVVCVVCVRAGRQPYPSRIINPSSRIIAPRK